MVNNGNSDTDWHPHVFRMPDWVEPVLIVSILFSSMFFTRAKNFSIFPSKQSYTPIASSPTSISPRSSADSDPPPNYRSHRSGYPHKTRNLFGIWTVRTPNSSRFARHIHSRILQKFPFLVEMFYWVLQFFFYRLTAYMASVYYGGNDQQMWDIGQRHGVSLLELETHLFGMDGLTGTKRWTEWNIQQWFLAGARAGDWRGIFLTVLNRSYALIHIPGTVGFLAFYYYVSPSFSRFATARRTMTLCNLFAFTVFIFYPCMPPRLLPPEYGFIDTVNGEDANSVWQSGNFVNRLAAMPSMHFGYAFCIGCVFIYESAALSGVMELHRRFVKTRKHSTTWLPVAGADEENLNDGAAPEYEQSSSSERSPASRIAFFVVGVWYPSWVLLTIVATANHYFMDAFAASLVVLMSYLCNRFLLNFLVLEDLLLWAWRLEKPVPTTGMSRRKRLQVHGANGY